MEKYQDKIALIVDDNKMLHKLFGNYLKTIGFGESVSAYNATEAVSLLKQNRIDLILCDIHMPMVSGLTLLKTLRNSPAYKKIPVLLISSENGLEYVKTAMSIGIDGYLVKPVTQEDLEKKVASIFAD